MSATEISNAKFDPLDPALLDDPYPVYERLRAGGPVCRGGPAQWVVTRYSDVKALLKDERLSSEFPAEYHQFALGNGAASTFLRRIILTRDPPDHLRLRRLMGGSFSSGFVRRLSHWVDGEVAGLLAPIMDTRRMDAVADLGIPLPMLIISELLGVPASDRAEVWPHAAHLAKAVGAVAPSETDRACADQSVEWLRGYLGDLLRQRRAAPGDDQLSRMITARQDRRSLSDDDIVDNAVFLFFAGFETTRGMISTGCVQLMSNPGQAARLRADPSMIPGAVEEFVRFDAPVQWVARIASEPLAVAGHTIRRGRAVVLLLGSANRDERQFHAPARFCAGRVPNPHVGFGGGIHQCLGRMLARAEGQALFRQLLDRFETLEPAGPPIRRRHPTVRGYASVPMTVRPR